MHAEVQGGGQRHAICLRTIKSRWGEGTGDQKLKVSYFLSRWSGCSSDPKVIGLIPDFCLLHVKVPLSKLSNHDYSSILIGYLAISV